MFEMNQGVLPVSAVQELTLAEMHYVAGGNAAFHPNIFAARSVAYSPELGGDDTPPPFPPR